MTSRFRLHALKEVILNVSMIIEHNNFKTIM